MATVGSTANGATGSLTPTVSILGGAAGGTARGVPGVGLVGTDD